MIQHVDHDLELVALDVPVLVAVEDVEAVLEHLGLLEQAVRHDRLEELAEVERARVVHIDELEQAVAEDRALLVDETVELIDVDRARMVLVDELAEGSPLGTPKDSVGAIAFLIFFLAPLVNFLPGQRALSNNALTITWLLRCWS